MFVTLMCICKTVCTVCIRSVYDIWYKRIPIGSFLDRMISMGTPIQGYDSKMRRNVTLLSKLNCCASHNKGKISTTPEDKSTRISKDVVVDNIKKANKELIRTDNFVPSMSMKCVDKRELLSVYCQEKKPSTGVLKKRKLR